MVVDVEEEGVDTQPGGHTHGSTAPRSLSLVIMGPSGTGTVALPNQGVLTLGRSPECDVRIDDSKLSRKHAELRCGATIELVDLGSRNGSHVRDERIPPNAPFVVRVGDSIGIGSTVLVLQRATPGGERPRHVWSHGYFEARLEEECARATHRGGAPFAIIRLRLEPERHDAATKEAGGASMALLAGLEGADMLGSYAPHEYEALYTNTSAEEADARAADLRATLRATKAPFTLAVAVFPRDGRTPEALIEHTTRALRGRAAESADPRAVVATGAIERMERVVERVAAGVINVLILGETGVGKDVLARRIHALSPRSKMPLVSLNCAALSESLLESELFGHEKGAFTGAVQAKQGLLESANGGVVFLDEVGEMPLSTQAKLLRVLEAREVTRVGALRPRAIDVRFFAATNRNLEIEIAERRFRRDLYFRLNGISLSLPALRERVDEIEPLSRLFVDEASRAAGRTDRPAISREAMEILKSYQWPGNIRELRNVIERAVLLCGGDVIGREHLPVDNLGPVVASPASGVLGPRLTPAPPPIPRDARRATIPAMGAVSGPHGAEDEERRRIVEALDQCAGNQSHAAKVLGISRATLIRRIEDFAIPRPRKRE